MQTFKQFLTEGKGKVIKYSSTQINFPPELASEIINWAEGFIDPDDVIEWEDNIHTTALYGLHTRDPKDVLEEVQGFGPVEIILGKTSAFEGHKQDVLKFDINSFDIKRLESTLRNLPYSSDYPEYIPHTTIAYLKCGKVAKYIDNTKFMGDKFSSTTIQFSTPKPNRIIHYIDLN